MTMSMMVKMMMDWLGLQGRGGGVWEGGLYPIPLICFYVMTMSNAHSGDLESAQSVEPVWHQLPESSIDRFGWVLQTQIRSLQQISVTYYSFACQVGWFLPEPAIAPFHACPRNYAGDCLCSISGCVGNAMTDMLVLLSFAKQHTGLICWETEEKHPRHRFHDKYARNHIEMGVVLVLALLDQLLPTVFCCCRCQK